MKRILFLILSCSIFQFGFSQKITEKDFKSHFDSYGVEGCFVLFDQATNEYVRYNPGLCDSGYIPASTFKIPNAVIALEEGIIGDTNQLIKWNGYEWPSESWNQDQTLKTAMKYSCVWVFTGFAEQIGIEKYHNYVESFNYGNKNLIGQPSRFWLAGLLRISANQQIDFLRKFYNYELAVSKQSIDMVKDILIIEQATSFKLSGKTGGGMLPDKNYIMWLVGYIEKDDNPYFYAMNFESNDFDTIKQARYEITKDILRELKLIE